MKYIHPRRALRFLSKKTQELFQRLQEQKVSHNYSRVLRRLRKKVSREKIRVVFYTNEPQKWSYESLYREFEKSPLFDPLVVVVPRYMVHLGRDHTRMTLEEQYDFYKSRNYHVEFGYVNGTYVEIKAFRPDVFFYMQLAEVHGIDDPLVVSQNALTFYCPYFYQLADHRKNYLQNFHKLLYVCYLEHELNLKRFESYGKGNSRNCVALGYPKLDVYFKNSINVKNWQQYWKEPEKFKIIYAPHHSFADEAFKWGTFPENYQLILSLAKTNKETTWVFKPHPMLRRNICLYGIMTEAEADEYYNEWARIGCLYDNGDYFDIFKSSDLMITDCCSFLAEYLPSHKPLIRLVNKEGLAFNELGERLSSCYYNVYNNEELLHVFDEVVNRRNDYLREDRNRISDSLVGSEMPASLRIYKDLLCRIKDGKRRRILMFRE